MKLKTSSSSVNALNMNFCWNVFFYNKYSFFGKRQQDGFKLPSNEINQTFYRGNDVKYGIAHEYTIQLVKVFYRNCSLQWNKSINGDSQHCNNLSRNLSITVE